MTRETNFRYAARTALETLGLLQTSRALRQKILHYLSSVYGISPSAEHRALFRSRKACQQRLATFSHQYADTFRCATAQARPGAKRVLIVSGASLSRTGVELCLIRSLEIAGCLTMPLIVPRLGVDLGELAEDLGKYYNLLTPTDVRFWRDFCDSTPFRGKAESVIRDCGSLDELLDVRFAEARVGGYAIASTRRNLKVGGFDLNAPFIRDRLIESLSASMASAAATKRIVQELQPSLVLTEDTAYTPKGEILDVCVETGIPVIRWFPAHNGSALVLKRYTSANRDDDLNSLSDASWLAVRKMDWNDHRSEELKRELGACYARGDWYGEAGTQFDKCLLDVDAVRHRLHLDPSKKTAFIFPHISWDASFGRGQDLFESYDEWLIETVRAACANEKLQWLIKIHPAHVLKSLYDQQRPTEEETLRMRIGRLPPHVSLLLAESDISTFSLFPVMDYCLTVRGTAGLEAACLGIPALTGGTGRYDRKGFTIDSATPQQYLERVAHIQDIPRLSPAQIELAERYAYGLFLLRPLPLSSVTLGYNKKYGEENFFSLVQINMRTRKDWEKAPDLRAFADWVTKSDEEDFLRPFAADSTGYWEDQRERVVGVV